MQSVSSRLWTRVAVSISYDDNNYTTGTSTNIVKQYDEPYNGHISWNPFMTLNISILKRIYYIFDTV